MSFFSWLLRALLVLSFVLGTGAHAGTGPDVAHHTTAPVAAVVGAVQATTVQAVQPHCADETAAGQHVHNPADLHTSAHTGADVNTDAHASVNVNVHADGAQHDPASGCCKVMSNCHCAGSHCASWVFTPMASAHGDQRRVEAPFSGLIYGSPALALSIKPPIA